MIGGVAHPRTAWPRTRHGCLSPSRDETRLGLAPQMTYLMDTGRSPTYRRYGLRATRKDDATWAFETGLDCVPDGIAARLGI